MMAERSASSNNKPSSYDSADGVSHVFWAKQLGIISLLFVSRRAYVCQCLTNCRQITTNFSWKLEQRMKVLSWSTYFIASVLKA